MVHVEFILGQDTAVNSETLFFFTFPEGNIIINGTTGKYGIKCYYWGDMGKTPTSEKVRDTMPRLVTKNQRQEK